MKPTSVCVIIEKEGKFLGVSRKDNLKDFGLPGGKIEKNETPEQAIIRECFEETGVLIQYFYPVYTGFCGAHIVQCFICECWDGNLCSEESGLVKWVIMEELIKGSFGKYNKRVFETLGWT